ncbi:MAG: hypothetical protein WEG40_14575 [Candidatus Rokuibacteriota bacterium]
MSTPLAAAAERLRGKPGRPRRTSVPDVRPSKPETIARLLDIESAARYLSISPWSVRDLIASGTIQRVVIPSANGKDLRRVLLDRQQLDELVLRWRETAP